MEKQGTSRELLDFMQGWIQAFAGAMALFAMAYHEM